MDSLIDSSLWIDLFRARTPAVVRRQVLGEITRSGAALAEPVRFEIRRGLPRADRARVEAQLATMPMLASPPDLWPEAGRLGQLCGDEGVATGAMDLLIAAVAIHHAAEVVTFDEDFTRIAQVCALRVRRLERAA